MWNIKAMKLGQVVKKKKQGGTYIIIGIINCERCKTIIGEREVIIPSKAYRKNGRYYAQYSWCYKCGLYDYLKSSNTYCF